MGHRRLLITVLAAAALFGAAISGCNREREPRLASASQRRGASLGGQPRAEMAEGLAVRPAEVLSASAHRMAPMRRTARRPERRAQQQQYARRDFNPLPPMVRSGDLARYEPLPEPIPVNQFHAARAQTYQTHSGPYYASAGAPPVYNQTSVPVAPPAMQTAFVSAPYTLVPSRTQPGMFEKVYEGDDGRGRPAPVHPSPELTVARAQLQGSPVLPLGDRAAAPMRQQMDVPLPTPESFPAPIPELEPIRYSRAPAGREIPPMPSFAMAPVYPVQQPEMWPQQQPVAMQPQSVPQPQQPQRPLPPLPSAYTWGDQFGVAQQPAPVTMPTTTTTTMPAVAEPYQAVPALPAVTPAIQGWVASPTTAMRVFK